MDVDVFTSDDVPNYRRTPIGYISSNVCSNKLSEVLHRKRPDVVHLHNFYHELSPGILKSLAAYRSKHELLVVMTAHDYHLVCPNSGLSCFSRSTLQMADVARLRNFSYLITRRWDERSIAHSLLKLTQHIFNYRLLKRHKVIDRILCPSKYIQSVLSSTGLATTHFPLPVPKAVSSSPRPESALRMVFAGRVEPEKGLAQFLENLPCDLQGKFIVIGDGSQLQLCRDICRQRQMQVVVDFVGKRTRDETLSIISESHLLVLPSVCVENSPLSLLEALAVGTNILVSDFGGMKEIVECAGVGFTFMPGLPPSLVEALDRVLDCFGRGTLNGFDVSRFLSERNEQAYLDRLIRAYHRQWSALDDPMGDVGVPAV